ncbi:peptide ABC transporter ATP-binding protein [Methylobacterium tarhaniae]|uniref:Peptide ABC transporter ATP-binding protein n=1 Tax=Methylobacterium tarhaniae TaxID=1187852 RepID=A0A0J6VUF2_9HYPH|nr:DMT family transporter [Methylobacterium tarhaniae]KMO42921.1 peptide ABC transporter ATP-binding protein [Methylobacterium tarhaniae]
MSRLLPLSDASWPTRLAPGLFVLIWATGFIVARLIAPHAEPLTFLSVRFGLTAIVLTGLAFAVGARWPRGWQGWRDAMVAGILIHGLYLDAVFWAVHRGLPAGIAALVASLQPLLTAAVAGPLLGERVSARRWLGIAVGFVGAGLVMAPRIGAAGGIPPEALAVCFCGTIAITLGTLWQKRTAAAVDLRTNAAVQFVGAGLLTLPLALLTERGEFDLSVPLLLGLAWAVFGLSVGGILILLGLIRRGAVAGVAALFYLVPPVSAAMAFGLFGETLAPIQLLGMVVAVAGVGLASRG